MGLCYSCDDHHHHHDHHGHAYQKVYTYPSSTSTTIIPPVQQGYGNPPPFNPQVATAPPMVEYQTQYQAPQNTYTVVYKTGHHDDHHHHHHHRHGHGHW